MSPKPNSSPLKTTVVGSYPATIHPEKILHQYYFRKDSCRAAINKAILEQENAGIDIISDGQVRADIVSLVATCCHGIASGPRPKIISEIKRKCPITFTDLGLAKNIIEKDVQLKGIITGPYTLSKNCINNYYKNDNEVAWAFVDVLKEEIKDIKGIVDMIQIDEPFLSVEYNPDAKEMIRELTKGIKTEIGLHVCGDLKSIFSALLEYDVDLLDHEFVSYPKNIDLLKEYTFKKKIGYGCVSVEDRIIESVEQIRARIDRALEFLPPDQLIIDPDCGLRNLTRNLAFGKLKNMVTARDETLKELKAM